MASAPRWAFVPGQRRVLESSGDGGGVNALALSAADDTLFAATDKALLAWPLGAACAAPRWLDVGPPRRWTHLAVARDGRRVYAARDNVVHSFASSAAVAEERILFLAPPYTGDVTGLAACPRGAALFVALSAYGVLELPLAPRDTDAGAGEARTLLRGRVRALVACPRGAALACVTDDGVRVLALRAAQHAASDDAERPPLTDTHIGTRAERIRTVAWGADGASLFCGRSSSVREWARDADGGWVPRRRSACGGNISLLCAAPASPPHLGSGVHDVAVAGHGVLLVWHLGAREGSPAHTNLVDATLAPGTRYIPSVRAVALSADGCRVFAALQSGHGDVAELHMRPPRAWSTRAHASFPDAFRAAVRTLLLCLARVAATRELRWQPAARHAFAEAAAAALAAQLYAHHHAGRGDG
jgi:hypothetical protein